jgi:adenylate cyclase
MRRTSARGLAADVARYSRLIEADEEGTLRRLKALRAELIDPKIAGHHGRSPGRARGPRLPTTACW